MTDLAARSARALAADIRDGRVSSLEVTHAAIKRLVACHELTHCVASLEAADALDAARAVDAAIAAGGAAGALTGVPLAHKDMFDRAGRIASWGASIRADRPADRDAAAIAALKAAGALQIAALNLAEFAYGATGHNYAMGHARNPWDPARITGGSSSGTAAAVAYGAIPMGLGSDTGGSLRLPAACCGVTSIKPTWGRVSRAGAMRSTPSACLGAMSRTWRWAWASWRGPTRAIRRHPLCRYRTMSPASEIPYRACGSVSTRRSPRMRTPTSSAWSIRCSASWRNWV
jgi:aspartyl-tRNA(Asn)/glutamyl-tRNA(Gln) amidotransferase subunit A